MFFLHIRHSAFIISESLLDVFYIHSYFVLSLVCLIFKMLKVGLIFNNGNLAQEKPRVYNVSKTYADDASEYHASFSSKDSNVLNIFFFCRMSLLFLFSSVIKFLFCWILHENAFHSDITFEFSYQHPF